MECENKLRRALIADILTLAARIWGVKRADLVRSNRCQAIVRPRQAVYLIAREHGYSLPQISKTCGQSGDHNSIIYGIKKATYLEGWLPDFGDRIRVLRQAARDEGPYIPYTVDFSPEPMPAEALIAAAQCAAPPPPPPPPQPKPKAVSPKKPKNQFENGDGPFVYQGNVEASLIRANSRFVRRLRAAIAARAA